MCRSRLVVLTFASMCGGSFATAQERPPAPPTDLLRQVRALGLPSSTDRLTVYYDPGHEAKAVRLRTLIQDAMQFYADSLGVAPELSIAVLERPNWDRLIRWQPYGIPGVEGTPAVAFLPATDDNLAANDALSLESQVSDSARRLVAAGGHGWPSASRRYVDYVGLHELGHTLVKAYGIQVRSMWFNEWLATYVGYSWLRAARPADARLWEGVLQGYRDAVRPEHRSLEAFDRLYFGVGAQNYVWYQARFQQSVQAVHDMNGVTFLRRVKEAFPRGGSPVSRDDLLKRLETLAPGFLPWAEGMK
ncbi:MAG: hypothetical protein H7066_21050 [Cytophagaceae bacterium]|nr:hypothetical protein [Gemmatimonadaceae bacterium]